MEVGEMDSPVWVPDSSAPKCMHCRRSEFSMLNRRVSCKLLSEYHIYAEYLGHLNPGGKVKNVHFLHRFRP